jgi:hypothetical protein
MYIEGNHAWMRSGYKEDSTAYVWDLTGKAGSLTEGYDVNWTKTLAWHRLQDATAAWEELTQEDQQEEEII